MHTVLPLLAVSLLAAVAAALAVHVRRLATASAAPAEAAGAAMLAWLTADYLAGRDQ